MGIVEQTHRASQGFLLSCVLIVLFAASVRVYHIATRSLWLDEATAANISRGTLAQTLTLTRALHSAPITHPLILYASEKIATGTLSVRFPSLLASVLTVGVMLCFAAIPSVGYGAAALSGLMLAISASQIRYAQEVREYSLSVLFAALLLYSFLLCTSSREKEPARTSLYLTLLIAPLVQYGLVLFGIGILVALLVVGLTGERSQIRIRHVLVAGSCLFAGSLLSYVLTLRYQLGYQFDGRPWYLQGNYFTPGTSFIGFIFSRTYQLFEFLFPGRGTALISAGAIGFLSISLLWTRKVSPLFTLAITSVGTVLACALAGLYPYGGVRQCLFLAPVLCLLASTSLIQVTNRLSGNAKTAAVAAMICLVALSGARQIESARPYAEVENIRSVLAVLRAQLQPADAVYVYSGAVPAVDFYLRERDPRFIYGDLHRNEPEAYLPELLAGIRPETRKTWIVFSHIYENEDHRILQALSTDWKVEPALLAEGSALYLAQRRGQVANDVSAQNLPSTSSSLVGVHSPDTFWDWNIRNSTKRNH